MATHEENTKADPMFSLPDDIISKIFSSLPAETLLDLEDDCESLKSIISSPDFIKTHLSKSTNDPHLAHHRLLLITWPYVEQANTPYMKLSTCSVHSLLNDESVPETFENYHPGDDNIHVVGYCNGLFCLTSRFRGSEQIFLWNPLTSSTRLPEHEHEHRAHWFCYDESNDDYKVFAIFGPGDEYEYNVSVYSSKSGCWRIIGDYCFGQIYGYGYFANGAIHSLVDRKKMQSNDMIREIIVSLDIKTETYREVPLPKEEVECRHVPKTLGTFGESLSVMYYFRTCAEFWVMKECGVEESWTKLFTIPFMIGLPCYDWIKPLCISVTGDIMLLSGSTIVLYNRKDNTFKTLLAPKFSDDTLYVYTYAESLVSPP